MGDSPKQVQRDLGKLTKLIPELPEKVDDGSNGIYDSCGISIINRKKNQKTVLEAMESNIGNYTKSVPGQFGSKIAGRRKICAKKK